MKQIVIIKDSTLKVKIQSDYLEVTNIYENRVIGLRNISELYINQQISIIPSKFLKLSIYMKIYFIDFHGHILGSIKREENEKI